MFYDALVAASRRNDSLDAVRTGALHRVRRLAGLLEPDDAYLCIVPARGKGDGKVFLPFEDGRPSLILSKAFLLAADTKISDETILRQIKKGAR
ncbi:DUF7737 domain-containing protein [Streptomyces sp. NPDC002676]